MQNVGLDEAQVGIKVAGRNTNNLRCADNTTLMAESKEELESLLVKGKEESEKAGLKLSMQKVRSWHINEETMEAVTGFIFLGSKITADGDCSHEVKRHLLLGKKAKTNIHSIYKAETLLSQQRSI